MVTLHAAAAADCGLHRLHPYVLCALDLQPAGYSSKAQVEQDAKARETIAALANYHVLPTLPVSRAVWTAPFMIDGVSMQTALGSGHDITAEATSDGMCSFVHVS